MLQPDGRWENPWAQRLTRLAIMVLILHMHTGEWQDGFYGIEA